MVVHGERQKLIIEKNITTIKQKLLDLQRFMDKAIQYQDRKIILDILTVKFMSRRKMSSDS